jgi:hypothetical protein
MFFYDLYDVLRETGVQVSLNRFDKPYYDVAIIHWGRPDAIRTVLNHSPDCRIGILSPGGGLKPEVQANTDFLLVNGFMWAELLQKHECRIHFAFDYAVKDDLARKVHQNGPGPLIIGYCGNPIHYAKEFFPHGAAAVSRLAKEKDLVFRVITNGAANMPAIPGVRMDFQEWKLETHEALRFEFDIGVCPCFANFSDLNQWTVHIRDSNRARSLLHHAIPSVISPVFQALQELRHGEHTLFAYSEDGWYSNLRRLAENPGLRQSMGDCGRELMRSKFSRIAAGACFKNILDSEMQQPIRQKYPELLIPKSNSRPYSFVPTGGKGNIRSRPWLVCHPHPEDAVIVSSAGRLDMISPGVALGSTSGCLAFCNPFNTKENPTFASPHPVLYLPPETTPTPWTDVARRLLTARIFSSPGLIRYPPRIARRVLLDTTSGNLLLGWLHKNFGCKIVLMIQSPWDYVTTQLNSGAEPLLPSLLSQPKLGDIALRPFIHVIKSAESLVAQHAASWCIQHLVPLRDVSPDKLVVLHCNSWLANPASVYNQLAAALDWPVCSKIAANLRSSQFTSSPPNDPKHHDQIMDIVRSFGLDKEARLADSLFLDYPQISPGISIEEQS